MQRSDGGGGGGGDGASAHICYHIERMINFSFLPADWECAFSHPHVRQTAKTDPICGRVGCGRLCVCSRVGWTQPGERRTGTLRLSVSHTHRTHPHRLSSNRIIRKRKVAMMDECSVLAPCPGAAVAFCKRPIFLRTEGRRNPRTTQPAKNERARTPRQ